MCVCLLHGDHRLQEQRLLRTAAAQPRKAASSDAFVRPLAKLTKDPRAIAGNCRLPRIKSPRKKETLLTKCKSEISQIEAKEPYAHGPNAGTSEGKVFYGTCNIPFKWFSTTVHRTITCGYEL
jgi:hypothetical protein